MSEEKVEETDNGSDEGALLYNKRVKAYIGSLGLKSPADITKSLEEVVKDLIKKAAVRTKSNDRVTLRAEDL